MRTARRYPVRFILLLSLPLFIVRAACAADTGAPASDNSAWHLLIVFSAIGVIVAAWILWFSFRLIRTFGESTSYLIDTLRALAPMPVVTLSDEIPVGVDGLLGVTITGFSSVPLGQVTVVLAPPLGLELEDDHFTLPRLDAGETKIFRSRHGPAKKGKHRVRITVLYRIGDEERVQEFTRTVYAGNPAGA